MALADYYWKDVTGDHLWATGGNWVDGNGTPYASPPGGAEHNVFFAGNATLTSNTSCTITGNDIVVRRFIVSSGYTGTITWPNSGFYFGGTGSLTGDKSIDIQGGTMAFGQSSKYFGVFGQAVMGTVNAGVSVSLKYCYTASAVNFEGTWVFGDFKVYDRPVNIMSGCSITTAGLGFGNFGTPPSLTIQSGGNITSVSSSLTIGGGSYCVTGIPTSTFTIDSGGTLTCINDSSSGSRTLWNNIGAISIAAGKVVAAGNNTSSFTFAITGNVSIGTLEVTCTRPLQISAGITLTVTSLIMYPGTTIRAAGYVSSPYTNAILSVSSGKIENTEITIQEVTATGGAVFFTGRTSSLYADNVLQTGGVVDGWIVGSSGSVINHGSAF